VPLVKEAKFAKTFVCLYLWLACFSIPTCETTLHVSVSQRQEFFNTRNSRGCALKECLFYVEIPCINMYQLFFSMMKLGQICHFLKELKSCLFLRLTQSHLNSLSKDNCSSSSSSITTVLFGLLRAGGGGAISGLSPLTMYWGSSWSSLSSSLAACPVIHSRSCSLWGTAGRRRRGVGPAVGGVSSSSSSLVASCVMRLLLQLGRLSEVDVGRADGVVLVAVGLNRERGVALVVTERRHPPDSPSLWSSLWALLEGLWLPSCSASRW